MLPEQRGVDHAERAALEGRLDVVALPLLEAGCARLEVNRARRAEILGRLEDDALLAVVEGDGLHVVEREAPQVDRAVLGVAQLDTVVEDPHVVGAHRADVDRLQTAHAAVVLDLHPREVAQRVGHVVGAQPLERLSRELLHGNHLAAHDVPRDDHLLDMLQRVEALGVCRHACIQTRTKGYEQS